MGPGWDRLPGGHALRRFVRGGALRTEEWIKAVAGCKIAFNHMGTGGSSLDPAQVKMANSRFFELLGCGAFQLVDAKADVLRLFQPGREVACFETAADLLEQVRHYLEHKEQREEIQRRARTAALAAHTYEHRLNELLKACGF